MALEKYLKEHGYKEKAVECVCPHCVTVADFATTHKAGRYILMCQDRAILVLDGSYVDFNNSGDEIVLYYYEGEKINVPTESL